MDEASRLGGRDSRWGFDGCDWLAMQLDFAFGGSAARIAERHGVSEDRVKARARADGWRRDHSDKELLEMMCSVQLARVHEAMREGQDGKQVSRSKSLRSLQLAADCERARVRAEAARAREIEERERVAAEAARSDDGQVGDDERDVEGGSRAARNLGGEARDRDLDDLRKRIRLVFERQIVAASGDRGPDGGSQSDDAKRDAGGDDPPPVCAVGS